MACDGAGSASRGGEGASLVARRLSLAAEAHLRTSTDLPSDELVGDWVDSVRDLIAAAAERRGLRPRDFATTLVMVVAMPGRTLTVHVGDGAAVGRLTDDGRWVSLSWPENGEFASTTFFVTDDVEVRLRIERTDRDLDRIAVMTDGIERLALDLAGGAPHRPFFQGISEPVAKSAVAGRDGALSRKLAQYLSSDAINARTDDDKTLIVASRRGT
ncbi:hypothetical protein FHT00_000114 [Sphingomonas insulae]|nr:hypothetical protein [Sphingomonas insulae]